MKLNKSPPGDAFLYFCQFKNPEIYKYDIGEVFKLSRLEDYLTINNLYKKSSGRYPNQAQPDGWVFGCGGKDSVIVTSDNRNYRCTYQKKCATNFSIFNCGKFL